MLSTDDPRTGGAYPPPDVSIRNFLVRERVIHQETSVDTEASYLFFLATLFASVERKLTALWPKDGTFRSRTELATAWHEHLAGQTDGKSNRALLYEHATNDSQVNIDIQFNAVII